MSRAPRLVGLSFVQVRPVRIDALPLDAVGRGGPAARAGGAPLHDAALVAGVRVGQTEALAEFHARFAEPMLRILIRVLGPDRDLADLHHDVFVRALQSIGELRDPQALRGWMSAIAVHVARACIERRTRHKRWLVLPAEDAAPEPEPLDPRARHDAREALRATYAVLDRLPADERVAFALRYFEELELVEIAAACKVSLSSIKRRLARAEARFVALARRAPALDAYLQGGSRWTRD